MGREYVIVDVKRDWSDHKPDSVLVVEKDRPEWQAGRWNLVGGKVEPFDRSPEDAAVRELKEESGYTDEIISKEVMGRIVDGDDIIHCVQITVKTGYWNIQGQEGETERVLWRLWDAIKDDPRLLPNLRVIIPMMRAGIKGFEIIDEYRSKSGESHRIGVVIPDPK